MTVRAPEPGWAGSIQGLSALRALIRRHRRALGILWLVAAVGVAVGSLVPELSPSDRQLVFFGLDKWLHLFAYAALAALPLMALPGRRSALGAAFAMIPFGIGIEIAQNHVPGRLGSIDDAVTDAIGVLLGMAIGLALRQDRR